MLLRQKLLSTYCFLFILHLCFSPAEKLFGQQAMVVFINVFFILHHTVYITVEPCHVFVYRGYTHITHHLGFGVSAQFFRGNIQVMLFNKIIADKGPPELVFKLRKLSFRLFCCFNLFAALLYPALQKFRPAPVRVPGCATGWQYLRALLP